MERADIINIAKIHIYTHIDIAILVYVRRVSITMSYCTMFFPLILLSRHKLLLLFFLDNIRSFLKKTAKSMQHRTHLPPAPGRQQQCPVGPRQVRVTHHRRRFHGCPISAPGLRPRRSLRITISHRYASAFYPSSTSSCYILRLNSCPQSTSLLVHRELEYESSGSVKRQRFIFQAMCTEY